MAVNTCVGFFWRQLIMCEISELAWDYFQTSGTTPPNHCFLANRCASVPVVVVCAPMGSLLASHFHRLVLASFVYVLEIVAVIGFLCTGPPLMLIFAGVVIVGAR